MNSMSTRILSCGRVVSERAYTSAFANAAADTGAPQWCGSFVPSSPIPVEELFFGGVEIELLGIRYPVAVIGVRRGIVAQLVRFCGTGRPPPDLGPAQWLSLSSQSIDVFGTTPRNERKRVVGTDRFERPRVTESRFPRSRKAELLCERTVS